MDAGREWVVDAFGCDAARLRSAEALGAVFRAVVRDLGLKPLGAPVWHVFPEPGGITGFQLLTESHLSCHTFPEHGHVALDLYCCRQRAGWPWAQRLRELLGADRVRVRELLRGQAGE
jgi:S-adenosylmethionine decarboxylase